MKRYLLVIIFLVAAGQVIDAQELWKRKRYEVVAAIGTSQFFGDIGGFSKSENILGLKDIILKQTRFNIHGGLKYRIIPPVSVKLGLNFGMLHATDKKGSNEGREMEAKTTFFEPALTCEYAFIKSNRENSYLFSKGRKMPFKSVLSSVDLYAFAGIGGVSYSVKGNDDLESSPNFTDGGFTAVIPAGIGANLLVTPDYNLGIEIGGRYAFSDFLDGYTSQYSKSNDVYYLFNVTFTYKIRTSSNGLPAFLSRKRF